MSQNNTDTVESKGTYAGVRFNKATVNKITKYLNDNNIPNAVLSDKLHSTILYSRKHLPNYTAQGKLNTPWIGIPIKFEIWPGQSGKNCLVLTYACKQQVDRHKYLMKKHDATFDYDKYTPHVTFSYDVGDIKDFKPFNNSLVIELEYQEDLDLDWADS